MEIKQETLLINEVKQGKQEAYSRLFDYLESAVMTTAMGMLSNFHYAEDIAQEVFVRLFKNISSFKGDSSIKTFAIRITINLCINHINKAKKKRWFSLSMNSSSESTKALSDHQHHDFELRDAINNALQQLEPEFRSVVILRLVEGYSTKETAQILEIPLGTVLSRLARAQKKLKNELEVIWKEE